MKSICRIVVFQIGTEYFGMEITRIEEIIKKTDTITTSSEKFSNIDEKLNWRENMIPVLNFYERLRIKPLLAQSVQYFMVINLHKNLMALPVDKLERHCDVSSQCLCPVPPILLNTGAQYFRWVAKIDGRIVFILEPEWLFKEMGEVNTGKCN